MDKRFKCPTAAAANAAVSDKPTNSVSTEITSRRHERSATYSTSTTMNSVAMPANVAPRVTLESSSCSIATLPLSRTVTGVGSAAFRRVDDLANAGDRFGSGLHPREVERRLQHDEAARARRGAAREQRVPRNGSGSPARAPSSVRASSA